MLTPRFNLNQDDDFVYISIHAPYSNIKDNECLIEDYDFIFYASPYFLRIRLPGKLKDSDKCKGKFDCDSQTYSLKIEKECHGEFYENLDMITNLLIPCGPKFYGFDKKIEVISSIDEDIHETVYEQSSNTFNSCGYGFANKNCSQFDTFDAFVEVFDYRPDNVHFNERHNKRVMLENLSFSSDHYLADLYDSECIEQHLKYRAPWQEETISQYIHNLTVQEVDLLKELPNKEYIFNIEERNSIMIGIIDIIYPLIYEYRTTANDVNPESSWTVNKLSSTLSCFATFHTMEDCVISLFRRSLIYPLYRNYDLSLMILNDVKLILKLGKSYIIKLFVEIHSLFNLSQASRYVLNDLYIKDYLIFIQKLSKVDINWLLTELDKVVMSKNKLCLELVELEEAAEIVRNDDAKNYEEIINLMSKCANVSDSVSDSDDSSSNNELEDNDSSSSCDNITCEGRPNKSPKCELYVNVKAE